MNVTDEEKEDLIEFLVRNLPDFPMRKAIASDAGLGDLQIGGDPSKSWAMLVNEANTRGKLRGLLMAAARQSPGDPAMQAMAEGLKHGKLVITLEEEGPDLGRLLVTGGFALLFIVFLGVVGLMYGPSLLSGGNGDGDEATEGEQSGEKPAVEVRHGLMTGDEKAPKPTTTAPATQSPDGTGEQPSTAPDEPEQPGSKKYLVIKDPTEEAGNTNTGCGGKQGTVIGYAYAGTGQPTVHGGVWAVASTATVRVAYPTPDNGFNAEAKVICTVPGGSSVPAGDAIPLDDGTWWVPIMGSGH